MAACGSGAGLANLFVSRTGSDTCSRSSSQIDYAHGSGHVCATPAAACKLGQSGDVVIVEDGSYSNIDFGGCTGHASYASNVVFEPEPGHECPMTYPSVPSTATTSCAVSFHFANDGFVGGSSSSCGVTRQPASAHAVGCPAVIVDQPPHDRGHLPRRPSRCIALPTSASTTMSAATSSSGRARINVTFDGGDYNNRRRRRRSRPSATPRTAAATGPRPKA